MPFPSDRTRRITLFWTVGFLTMLISGLTIYGSDTNMIHTMALEHSMTLYAIVVIAVIADTVVETWIKTYYNRASK